VRELKHAVHHAYVITDRRMAWCSRRTSSMRRGPNGSPTVCRWVDRSAMSRRDLIQVTSTTVAVTSARPAAMLGVSLKTLYNRLNEYASEPGKK
jgi:DNA-binding NtrC family response regulator